MQTAVALLPNHFAGIYKEMKGEVERQIFEIDFKSLMRGIIEDVSLIEFERAVIGVPQYFRGDGRLNYRNGFYERSLDAVFGWIEGIKIPRPRFGGFTPRCLGKKHARRQDALNRLEKDMDRLLFIS